MIGCLSDGLGGDDFLPCVTSGVKEGLHRRFAKAPPPLMSSCYIVAFDPAIEIALQLAQICSVRSTSGLGTGAPSAAGMNATILCGTDKSRPSPQQFLGAILAGDHR